jgi:hypothetical protein
MKQWIFILFTVLIVLVVAFAAFVQSNRPAAQSSHSRELR